MPTDPFIYAFLVTLVVGVITTLVFALLWKSAQKKLVTEQAAHAATTQNLVVTQAAVQLSEMARTDNTARLEAVITGLRKEIEDVEAVHSLDPEAQRARLAKLSGG